MLPQEKVVPSRDAATCPQRSSAVTMFCPRQLRLGDFHHLNAAAIILAAGKGTRMKSDLPKGLHSVCGLPIVEHVGRAVKQTGIARPTIVVGHGGEQIIEALGDCYEYVWQRE